MSAVNSEKCNYQKFQTIYVAMKKSIIFIVIIFLHLNSCSLFRNGSKSSLEFMPLSIGNEWHYRGNYDDKEIIEKVVSYSVIKNKTYSKILRTTFSNGSSFDFMYNLCVSNDTLFHLYFYKAANDYKETIEAVF